MITPKRLVAAVALLMAAYPISMLTLGYYRIDVSGITTTQLTVIWTAIVLFYLAFIYPRIVEAKRKPEYADSKIFEAWPTLVWFAFLCGTGALTFIVADPNRDGEYICMFLLAVLMPTYVYVLFIRPVVLMIKDLRRGLDWHEVISRRVILLSIPVMVLIDILIPFLRGSGMWVVAAALAYRGIVNLRPQWGPARYSGCCWERPDYSGSRWNKPDWWQKEEIATDSLHNHTVCWSDDNFYYNNNNEIIGMK